MSESDPSEVIWKGKPSRHKPPEPQAAENRYLQWLKNYWGTLAVTFLIFVPPIWMYILWMSMYPANASQKIEQQRSETPESSAVANPEEPVREQAAAADSFAPDVAPVLILALESLQEGNEDSRGIAIGPNRDEIRYTLLRATPWPIEDIQVIYTPRADASGIYIVEITDDHGRKTRLGVHLVRVPGTAPYWRLEGLTIMNPAR
jgi:hypothetical protein